MIHLIAIAFVTGLLVNSNQCDAATVGSASFLHGDGYVTGDDTRNIARFDVTHINKDVLLYGRADLSSFDDRNSSINTRMIGHYNTGFGFDLAGQYQNANKTSVSSIGLGVKSIAKDHMVLLDVYKQSHNVLGDATQVFAYVKSPEYNGFFFDGFVDTAFYKNVTVVLAQPSVMYKMTNSLNIGVEYQLYYNKFGYDGLDESVPQAKLKYTF
jgi:hypothetical protein